jgi:hypothetical protein
MAVSYATFSCFVVPARAWELEGKIVNDIPALQEDDPKEVSSFRDPGPFRVPYASLAYSGMSALHVMRECLLKLQMHKPSRYCDLSLQLRTNREGILDWIVRR